MRIDRRLLTLVFGGLFWRTFLLIALLIAVSYTHLTLPTNGW